ncbi:unnamed protein product [Effrenium voratum]|uniref:Polyadenylate-binding protein n=1 Tax=Effrenium voratum TaxID=2562239 RepID=A0AA36MW25_9DINO|nr:unnamed protein product [Effrenium voratum]CAJ1455710.1 unnamed protein product [Effrenium voratum]
MAGVPQFASLYVGDLHPDVTEAMLYEIFNSVGPVASIRVCRDSVSRKSLGYGYVNFHSVSDAERALDTLNYSSIKGRACRIMWSQRDPSLRKSGLGNVFVRNLDRNIDNKALYDTFSLFGNILSCKVSTGPDGKSRGYGFVHYETEEAAKQAIEKVDGMQIGEKTVGVSGFIKRAEREKPAMNTFTNIYIKNFPNHWEEDSIKTEFGKCGNITSSHMSTDNKGRKFAFLNFGSHEEAKQAIDTLHQKDFREAEQKEADKEKEEEEADRAEKSYLLYVSRAQSKSERLLELKEKMPPRETGPKSQGVNLYIKNLDENTDDDSLRGLFEPFGNITSVCAMKEPNGKCKGFGFVCFSSPDEATKAVTEMHLKVVKGKPLYVGLAEKREVRAERLRQRYSPSGVGGKGMGGKGKGGKGGMGMGGGGGMYGNPMGGMMPGMGPMMGMGMKGQGMGQGMMGKGKGMPNMPMNPQMMGMGPMGKGMPNMMGPMGKGGMPMPMGMGPMNPMGMMRPTMPQMPMMRPGMPNPAMPQPQSQPAGGGGGGQLTAAALAAAPPPVQKQMIGERLFPAISKYQPELAGKITGMMLEMDNSELLILLDSDHQLKAKVDEAMRVLEQAK